ncbi:MAG: MFS transporter [Symbiopectobacterium sp.]|uniref:MFS transporter n=1 Tax=Symbiopectobacterium sp. TaxID=2952789 RepID=UPI0039EC0779
MAVSQKELLYHSSPEASGWQQNSHQSLALIWMLGVVCVLDSAIISSLLTPIKAEFGFSDEQMGRFSSMFTLAGILGAPIMGTLDNRFSRKTVLLIGATVWSVASLSTGLATGFLGLLFWRVLTGTVAPGWLADLYRPRWRNVFFSLYMLRNKIGTAAALALGSLLASEYGWRTAFFVAGLPGIVLVLLFFIAMSVQIWIPAYLHRVFALTNPQASGFLAQVLLYTLPMGLIGGYFSSLVLRQYR